MALESGEEMYVFACGGDGTLCEVVNGAAGYGNVAVGVIPTGTGNDFVRNFSDGGQFFDIGAQLDGSVISADLIRANGKFCVNMINVGFDSETVANTAFFRQKFFLPNRLAYTFAMLVTLIKKPGVRMEISVDGKTDESLSLLLCTFANGAYCGGGYKSNPNAHPADGSIDCLLVNNVSRLKFLSLVGQYKKGEHLNDKTKDILKNVNFRSAVIDFGNPQYKHRRGTDNRRQAESRNCAGRSALCSAAGATRNSRKKHRLRVSNLTANGADFILGIIRISNRNFAWRLRAFLGVFGFFRVLSSKLRVVSCDDFEHKHSAELSVYGMYNVPVCFVRILRLGMTMNSFSRAFITLMS